MLLRTLLLLGVLLTPLATWAELPGVQYYERGEYERAAEEFKQVLASEQHARKEQGLARVYLAASLQALGRGGEVKQQLEVLAREHPEQQVDPALFTPELVELAEAVRLRVENERLRARVVSLRVSGERLREAEPASAFRLRPELSGFMDLSGLVEGRGQSWGVAVGLLYGHEVWEGGVRALVSNNPVLQLEAGVRLGRGEWQLQPRLGLRASYSPRLGAVGGGAVVGARLALTPELVALVDVSGEFFAPAPAEAPGALPPLVMISVGVGFDVPLR